MTILRGFNGATAVQPWIQRPPRTLVPQGFPDPFSSGPQQRQKIDLIFPSPAALNSPPALQPQAFRAVPGVYDITPPLETHHEPEPQSRATHAHRYNPRPRLPRWSKKVRDDFATRVRIPNSHRFPVPQGNDRQPHDHHVVHAALRRHTASSPSAPAGDDQLPLFRQPGFLAVASMHD